MTHKYDFPAFPFSGIDPQGNIVFERGVTARDWFAGMALQGIISGTMTNGGDYPIYSNAAIYAYQYADAMLEERNK